MKNSLVLFLLLHLNISEQIIENDKKIDSYYKGVIQGKNVVTEKYFDYKKDDDDYEYDHGNPDKTAIIERPCPVFDIFCIRKYFARHSNCKIVPGPVTEPFYITELQLNPTSTNITITVVDVMLSRFNSRIDEFYVNKKTGNLVLSVFFEDPKYTATAFLRFNRNGEEPVEVSALAVFQFVKLTITTVLPNYKNLILENAEVNGYMDDPFPPFLLLPTTLNVTDPTAIAELAGVFNNIPTSAIESIATISPVFASIFIQKNICDFGVPINRI